MTPAPFINMLRVDQARMGGAFASQRHAFGIVPPSVAPVEAATPPPEPPPKRVLAEGPMPAPELSQAQVAEIQGRLDTLADAVQLELEAVKAEADMVSGPALRVEPDLYKSIAVVGPYFTPQEIRNVLIMDARALETAAGRVLEGAASPYLTEEQRGKLETAVSDAKALVNYLQNLDLAPLGGEKSRFAMDHTATHMKGIDDLTKAVERDVVAGEAPAVPVKEPLETGTPWGAILLLGALVTVGILVSDLSS